MLIRYPGSEHVFFCVYNIDTYSTLGAYLRYLISA